MDNWQDAALTSRHLHNRVGKQGRGKGGRSNGAFDVHKLFGTYEVKCPAATKGVKGSDMSGKLEVYNLDDLGIALYGELLLPSVVHGVVVLAGSRKTMRIATRELGNEGSNDEEEKAQGSQTGDVGNLQDSSNYKEKHGSVSAEEEECEHRRHDEFEKNSFRSPKFWLNWQGEVLTEGNNVAQSSIVFGEATVRDGQTNTTDLDTIKTTDTGYLIFSGNNCDKFQGTLSCRQLGWDNVKLSGWKLKSQPARNFQMHWLP